MVTPENPNAGEKLIYVTVPVRTRLAKHIDAIAHIRTHQNHEPYDPTGMLRQILERGIIERFRKLSVSAIPDISR